MAVSGDDLFVGFEMTGTALGSGYISEYSTSGSVLNPSLVSGLDFPYALAVSRNNLFVGDAGGIGAVSEYNISGAPANTPLISGVGPVYDLAISDNDIFTLSNGATLGEYTTSGTTVMTTNAGGTPEIAIVPAPEPSTLALLALGAIAALRRRRYIRYSR